MVRFCRIVGLSVVAAVFSMLGSVSVADASVAGMSYSVTVNPFFGGGSSDTLTFIEDGSLEVASQDSLRGIWNEDGLAAMSSVEAEISIVTLGPIVLVGVEFDGIVAEDGDLTGLIQLKILQLVSLPYAVLEGVRADVDEVGEVGEDGEVDEVGEVSSGFSAMSTTRQADDQIGGARNLGTLTRSFPNARVVDSVGFQGDPQDYFRFTLAGQASRIQIRLASLSQDLDLDLLNGSQRVIWSGVRSGTSPELYAGQLSAGTYYLRVYPGVRNAQSSYSLEITATIQDEVIERKNFTVASNVVRTIRQSIGTGSNGREHWYQIAVTTTRPVSIELSGMSRDLDLELRNGSTMSSSIRASSRNSGTTAERLRLTLPSGTYWVRVYPYGASAATQYTLSLNLSGRVQ